MDLFDKVSEDIKKAMKAKDKVALDRDARIWLTENWHRLP